MVINSSIIPLKRKFRSLTTRRNLSKINHQLLPLLNSSQLAKPLKLLFINRSLPVPLRLKTFLWLTPLSFPTPLPLPFQLEDIIYHNIWRAHVTIPTSVHLSLGGRLADHFFYPFISFMPRSSGST